VSENKNLQKVKTKIDFSLPPISTKFVVVMFIELILLGANPWTPVVFVLLFDFISDLIPNNIQFSENIFIQVLNGIIGYILLFSPLILLMIFNFSVIYLYNKFFKKQNN
jgi:hypothetical protein